MRVYPFVDWPSIEALKQPDRTIYVTQSGSDLVGNGSSLAPFASITAALTAIGTSATVTDPYTVSVGPGVYAESTLVVDAYISIQGSTNTTIDATSLTLNEGSNIYNTSINTSNVTIEPSSNVTFQNVTLSSSTSNTTILNSGDLTVINSKSINNVTYEGGTVSDKNSTYLQTVYVTDVTNYSTTSTAYASLSVNNSTVTVLGSSFSGTATASNSAVISVGSSTFAQNLTATDSTVTVNGSTVSGDVTADNSELTVNSSYLAGEVDGSNNAIVELSGESYPKNGVSLATGATEALVPLPVQSIAVNAASTDGAAAVIGTVYFAQPRTLSAGSAVYAGGLALADVTVVTLVPASGGSPVATWSRTGTLGSQALTSGGAVTSAGWYDIILQGTSGTGTAFCKGLHLI